MKIKERYDLVFRWFALHRPTDDTELHYETPYELIVAVILSAQCTDKRVNMVTPRLFATYPTPEALAQATPEEVYEYIKSVSYPNNKSKHLTGMARMLVEQFGTQVPDQIDDLVKLPGVGRKTANVIASVIYDQPAMAVDTHVYRVSRRLGLVPSTANTPLKVERVLVRHIPKGIIPRAHHWLILHGRYVCLARKPLCHLCGLSAWCRYYSREKQKVT